MTERLRRSLTSLSGDALGSALRDVARSFGRLPGAKKAAVVGVGLLVLLVLLALLGPLALLVVALAFGAGLIGVIVRAAQRRSVTWRDPVAPALLALVLALVGVYDARHAADGEDTGGGGGGFVGDGVVLRVSGPAGANYIGAYSIMGEIQSFRGALGEGPRDYKLPVTEEYENIDIVRVTVYSDPGDEELTAEIFVDGEVVESSSGSYAEVRYDAQATSQY